MILGSSKRGYSQQQLNLYSCKNVRPGLVTLRHEKQLINGSSLQVSVPEVQMSQCPSMVAKVTEDLPSPILTLNSSNSI